MLQSWGHKSGHDLVTETTATAILAKIRVIIALLKSLPNFLKKANARVVYLQFNSFIDSLFSPEGREAESPYTNILLVRNTKKPI